MKVAAYAIALNEEKHAQRWADTTKDADFRLVCDTGSTDSGGAFPGAGGDDAVLFNSNTAISNFTINISGDIQAGSKFYLYGIFIC